MQVLAFLCLLQERTGIWGPHLVVAPLSVLGNWKDELTRVVAGARFHVYHGQREERREAFNAEMKKWRQLATDGGKDGGGGGDGGPVIVLTTYEMVLKDEATLRLGGSPGLEWGYLVVDEAHRLKNRHGKLLAAMQSLRARRRLLLTGTPLQVCDFGKGRDWGMKRTCVLALLITLAHHKHCGQNDLSELFSLLSFVQPSLFKRVHTLQDWFDQPFEGEQQQHQKGK